MAVEKKLSNVSICMLFMLSSTSKTSFELLFFLYCPVVDRFLLFDLHVVLLYSEKEVLTEFNR